MGKHDLLNTCTNCGGRLDDKRKCCNPNCGVYADDSLLPAYALQKRTLLNERFLIAGLLGKGGFGITYRAWDTSRNAKVAIKEYFPDAYGMRIPGQAIVAAKNRQAHDNYERWKELFVGEAVSLFKLRDIINIVTVEEYFPLNNTAYIVMEFLEGPTLSKYIELSGGAIPFNKTLAIIKPVMQGLISVHNRGVLHRDISPDNIVIVDNKYVKLIDFGGAKRDMFDPANTFTTLKPGYSPIEQYYPDKRQSVYTDVYALGATIYRCITGKAPANAISRFQAESLLLPSRLGVSIHPLQERALLTALNLNPAERFQTINDFMKALFVEEQHQAVKPPYPMPSNMPAVQPRPAPAGYSRPAYSQPVPSAYSQPVYPSGYNRPPTYNQPAYFPVHGFVPPPQPVYVRRQQPPAPPVKR